MSACFLMPMNEIDVHQLASVIRNNIENVLIIDSRSFTEHNTCHIISAVNICYSKVVKRRLQQDKLSVKELLIHTCNCDVDEKLDVIVYDQSTKNWKNLPADGFIVILIKKLQLSFRSLNLLSGGFEEFRKCYPDLCEERFRKCPPYTSLSQPCLPLTNQGATRILPFLYLGTQLDAMNQELLKDCNITYELNVSTTCPQPDFLPEGHFMRIPVNDSYSEKLLPYFPQAFNFLDKVREGSGCVLVHCLAGISRSPTIVIAYVMRYLHLSSDDGYRYVKSKRPTISPNFNFLGQLLEYEKELRVANILEPKPEARPEIEVGSQKRLCKTDMRKLPLSLNIDRKANDSTKVLLPKKEDHSPTSALAKLSFDVPNSEESKPSFSNMSQLRSKSCYGDWLRSYSDEKKPSEIPAAKILSPVKEIKCDGLISEISTGYSEINVKSKEGIRQRINFFSSNTKSHDYQKTSENIPRNKKKFLESRKYKWQMEDKKETDGHSAKANIKFPFIPHVRSSENLYQIENSMKTEGRQTEHSYRNKNRPFHYSLSLNSDLHKLSDPPGTSAFVNENLTHRTFNFNQMKNDMHLEGIFINKNVSSNPSTSEKELFFDKKWTPGSNNSDYHLTDDSTERNIKSRNKTDLSHFIGSKYLKDSKNFQDCVKSVSSMFGWSRKRGADSDIHLIKRGGNTPTRDKRKYEPHKKSTFPNFMEHFLDGKNMQASSSAVFPHNNEDNFLNGDSYHLYRAQSCPVILWSESTSYKHDMINVCEFQLQKKFPRNMCSLSPFINGAQKELSCHESCPDVLNLEVVDKFLALISHRQKQFHRNMVKAS